MQGRSTLTNLIIFSQSISETLKNYQQLDFVYLDFSKAFDLELHKLLLQKLKNFGIFGQMLKWLSSYLINYFQIVKIEGLVSYKIPVPSGVFQRSHCDPVSFNIFINDIQDQESL